MLCLPNPVSHNIHCYIAGRYCSGRKEINFLGKKEINFLGITAISLNMSESVFSNSIFYSKI